MGPASSRSLFRSLETHAKYSQNSILSRYTAKTRWPERRRQPFPSSLSTLSLSTTPPLQFSDSGFPVKECPSWPLGCPVLPQYVAASSPASGAFSSFAAHGITADFGIYPTLAGAQSELVSELNPTYTLVTHYKSCALRQSNRPFAFYVRVIVVFTFGVYGAAEKLRPLDSWYSA
ncbi:hypothetical protein B0T09DRAFT_36146 [Sordaria sp. MPI-SDFR-AT-0083]|nr:hypothetical protein B0T09DRAFT_36146 [Sordaria sp. MPI-SDFR-AT-0083]